MALAQNHSSQPTDTPVLAIGNKWRPLRIWPAILFLIGMVVTKYLPSVVEDGPAMLWAVAALGPLMMSVLLMLWWLLASRARWFERCLGFVGVVLACAVAAALLDPTMLGPAVMMFMIPLGVGLFGIGAIICSGVLSLKRTAMAVLLATCGFGSATLLRADGVWGHFAMGLAWRWKPTAEEQLANRGAATLESAQKIADDVLLKPEWPSFRGSEGNSRNRGTKLASNWSASPPRQIWKTVVGPGWSSFVVAGDWLFTQEQRGPMEAVVCYDARTGQEVWTQQVTARFEDPLGGPGPRATPTLAGGKLFALGAQGSLLCLNPRDGKVIWQQDVRKVAETEPPMWGFSSSPLVVEQRVVVHAGGADDRGILAFDVDSGTLVWSAACGKDSYSSPQLCNIAGEDSIVMLSNKGMTLLDRVSGKIRLDYDWTILGYRSLQPQMVDGNSILLPSGMGFGTRLVQIAESEGAYTTQDIWTSRQLKPDFNDFVIYQNHAYGFDALIFTCIDLATGERKWKGGRYGKGQVLLVEDSGLLLVVSEQGDVALVQAAPDKHTELATIKAIEGRTWNHPVLIGNRLYLRNSQEAACYELPTQSTAEPVAVLQ